MYVLVQNRQFQWASLLLPIIKDIKLDPIWKSKTETHAKRCWNKWTRGLDLKNIFKENVPMEVHHRKENRTELNQNSYYLLWTMSFSFRLRLELIQIWIFNSFERHTWKWKTTYKLGAYIFIVAVLISTHRILIEFDWKIQFNLSLAFICELNCVPNWGCFFSIRLRLSPYSRQYFEILFSHVLSMKGVIYISSTRIITYISNQSFC